MIRRSALHSLSWAYIEALCACRQRTASSRLSRSTSYSHASPSSCCCRLRPRADETAGGSVVLLLAAPSGGGAARARPALTGDEGKGRAREALGMKPERSTTGQKIKVWLVIPLALIWRNSAKCSRVFVFEHAARDAAAYRPRR